MVSSKGRLLPLGNRRRGKNGPVKQALQDTPWGSMRPQDWAAQQVNACWWPDIRTMDVIRARLAVELGCPFCAKRGKCDMQECVAWAERIALEGEADHG